MRELACAGVHFNLPAEPRGGGTQPRGYNGGVAFAHACTRLTLVKNWLAAVHQ